MQVAEVFRIGIVIPLTEETNIQFKNGQIDGLVEIKLLPLSQDDFYTIWETGLFEEINRSLNLKISEYEDNCIELSYLKNFIRIVQKYFESSKDAYIRNLLKEIYDVSSFSDTIKMPVYLIF